MLVGYLCGMTPDLNKIQTPAYDVSAVDAVLKSLGFVQNGVDEYEHGEQLRNQNLLVGLLFSNMRFYYGRQRVYECPHDTSAGMIAEELCKKGFESLLHTYYRRVKIGNVLL